MLQTEKNAKKSNLRVKEENTNVYELETNDTFDITSLSDAEIHDIYEHNKKFDETELQPALLSRFTLCACQQQRLLERMRIRMNLVGKIDDTAIELNQEDIDMVKFGIIIETSSGRSTGISAIVAECKECHNIRIWGAVEPITRILAVGFNEYIDSMKTLDAIKRTISNKQNTTVNEI